MIKVSGYYENKKDHRDRTLNISLQFWAYRHQCRLRLKDLAHYTGCTVTELDNFELGSGDIEVFLCLCSFYKRMPEFNGNFWELEIK